MADPLPSSTLPPSSPIVPAVVTRRRQRLLLAVTVVIVVLLLVGSVTVWLLRRSYTPDIPSVSAIPSPVTGSTPLVGAPRDTPPPGTSTVPDVSLYIPQDQRNNLAFTITYSRQPRFQLKLNSLERTFEQPTIQLYAPITGEPYSQLRLLDAQGQVFFDKPFKVLTEVVAESHDASFTPVSGIIRPLQTSEAYLVVPITASQVPARVQIVGQQGETFIDQTIEYANLPQVVATVPAAVDETRDLAPSPSPSAGFSWRRLFRRLALAQTPPAAGRIFTIVVINHNGAATQNAVAAVRAIVANLKPWSKYSRQIRVVSVQKNVDLGCRSVIGPSGFEYPICPQLGKITRELAGVQWNTIVVVTPIVCNCGTVAMGTPVMAIGAAPSASLIGHELAHSVGGLVDEYFYRFGVQGGPLGPNCFASRAACEQKRNRFSTLECAPGCRGTEQFRPHTLLMHNEFAQPYGEYDECLIEGKIAEVLGVNAECEPSTTPTPSPSPGQTSAFYGGRR